MAFIESVKARINLLEQRDPVVNARIIGKLKRKLRKLEALEAVTCK